MSKSPVRQPEDTNKWGVLLACLVTPPTPRLTEKSAGWKLRGAADFPSPSTFQTRHPEHFSTASKRCVPSSAHRRFVHEPFARRGVPSLAISAATRRGRRRDADPGVGFQWPPAPAPASTPRPCSSRQSHRSWVLAIRAPGVRRDCQGRGLIEKWPGFPVLEVWKCLGLVLALS